MLDENARILVPIESKINVRNSIDISIVIPSRNEGNNLRVTLGSIIKSENYLSYEIIVVDDGSTDQSTEFLKSHLNNKIYKNVTLITTKGLGCARARNVGAKSAKGKYLFFCDAHVKVTEHWLDKLVNTLENCNSHLVVPCITDMINRSIVCYGGTWNNKLQYIWVQNRPNGITEIPFAAAGNMAITKEAFEKINGFDELFQVYGAEDQELSIKAWLYGYRIVVNPNVKIFHLFREIHPYKVTDANVIFNTLCLAYSHFNKKRLINIINMLKSNSAFPIAARDIGSNIDKILEQREKYFRERIYDDDFFFKKFNISF